MLKKLSISFLSLVLVLFGLNIGISSHDAYAENVPDIFTEDINADFETVEFGEIEKEKLNIEETQEINNVFAEYNLEPLNLDEINLPNDAEVLNFESINEFEKYMDEIQKPIEIEVEEVSNSNTIAFINNIIGNKSASAAMKIYKTSANAGFGNINLYANVDRNTKGIITSTKVYTTHTGVTVGIDWNQTYAYPSLNSKKTGGKAYGGGTCSRYIFIAGIGTISKRDVALSLSF